MVRSKEAMDYTAFLLISGIFCICSSLALDLHYVPYYRTWPIAQQYCRTRFTDMATLVSMQDVNNVLQSVTSVDAGYRGMVWIGLKRSWGWSTGDPLSVNGWSATEPNDADAGAKCGGVTPTGWFDLACSCSMNFYCYQKMSTGSNQIIMIGIGANWFDALTYCRQHYTDLAIINSTQDQQFVTSYAGARWIGLTAVQWSDKTISSFRYWKTGLLEGPLVTSCVATDMADSGKWSINDCALQYPFMCYGGVDKMRVKKIVKLVLTSDGAIDPNDPSIHAVILNKIVGKVKERILNQNVTVWWKMKNDGKVFKKIIKI